MELGGFNGYFKVINVQIIAKSFGSFGKKEFLTEN